MSELFSAQCVFSLSAANKALVVTEGHEHMHDATEELSQTLIAEKLSEEVPVFARFYRGEKVIAMYYGRQLSAYPGLNLWSFILDLDSKYEEAG